MLSISCVIYGPFSEGERSQCQIIPGCSDAIALGVSLLLGLLTVLSRIDGALWQFNIAIGSFSVPGEWYWHWPLLIVPHLVFAHSRAGRVVGLDLCLQQWLAKDPKAQTRIGRSLRRLT
jgi:hypothetical protein